MRKERHPSFSIMQREPSETHGTSPYPGLSAVFLELSWTKYSMSLWEHNLPTHVLCFLHSKYYSWSVLGLDGIYGKWCKYFGWGLCGGNKLSPFKSLCLNDSKNPTAFFMIKALNPLWFSCVRVTWKHKLNADTNSDSIFTNTLLEFTLKELFHMANWKYYSLNVLFQDKWVPRTRNHRRIIGV